MDFEVLINSDFVSMSSDASLRPVDNKSLISLINDFEDSEWRYSKFQNFIWDNIKETSLSFRERQSLVDSSHTQLTYAAKNLRISESDNDIGKGSEIAEVVLYAIMKHHFGALPVVPKIFYKQNSQDNAKGVDSVHIVLIANGDFELWFGEAKFYNSIEDSRLNDIAASVEKALLTEKLKKELSIITNVSDIDEFVNDEVLRLKIRDALSPHESIDKIKPKLNVPILILHECEITQSCTSVSAQYKRDIVKFHKERAEAYFRKQITKLGGLNMYSQIKFHLILFPVPRKDVIVDKFISIANFYKNS